MYLAGEQCFSQNLIGSSIPEYSALITSEQNKMAYSFVYVTEEHFLINKVAVQDNTKKATKFGNQAFKVMNLFYFLAINALRMCFKMFVYKWLIGDKTTFRKVFFKIHKNMCENSYARYIIKNYLTRWKTTIHLYFGWLIVLDYLCMDAAEVYQSVCLSFSMFAERGSGYQARTGYVLHQRALLVIVSNCMAMAAQIIHVLGKKSGVYFPADQSSQIHRHWLHILVLLRLHYQSSAWWKWSMEFLISSFVLIIMPGRTVHCIVLLLSDRKSFSHVRSLT